MLRWFRIDLRQRLRMAGWAAVLAGGAILLAAGCEEDPIEGIPLADPGAKAPMHTPGYIAFVSAGRRDPLWPVLETSAQRYHQTLGTIETRYLTPAGDSSKDQIALLESLTEVALRGVCVQIRDPVALEPTLHKLYERGVRIVSMVQPAPVEWRVGHAGFDEKQVGEMLAEAAADALGEKGTLMVLHAGSEHPVYGERLWAFRDRMKWYPQIEVLAWLDCEGNGRRAREIVRERFARFPRLSAFIAVDDWPFRNVGITEDALPTGSRCITVGGYPRHWGLVRNEISPRIVAANYRDLGARALQFCEVAIGDESRIANLYHAPLRVIQPMNLDAYIADWTSWARPDRDQPKPVPGTDTSLPTVSLP